MLSLSQTCFRPPRLQPASHLLNCHREEKDLGMYRFVRLLMLGGLVTAISVEMFHPQ